MDSYYWNEYVVLDVEDESGIRSVDGNAFYTTAENLWQDGEWKPDLVEVTPDEELDGWKDDSYKTLSPYSEEDDYVIRFKGHRFYNDPERVSVSATDKTGNKVTVEIDITETGARIAKMSMALLHVSAYERTFRLPKTGLGISVGSLGKLLKGGIVTYAILELSGTQTEKTTAFGYTKTVNTYEGTAIGKVRLGQGWTNILGTRGFGWKYIAATTSLTQTEIGNILNDPDQVVSEGDVTYVIEKSTNDRMIVLVIIGGTLMAAEPIYSVVDGTKHCREVHYTEDHLEHASREEKHIDEDAVLDGIRDPDAVGKGDKFLYYVRELGDTGKYYILRVNKNIPKQMVDYFYDLVGVVIEYSLGTSLIDKETGDLFDTLEDAKEHAEDNSEKRNDGIDDWNNNPEGC